MLEEQRKVFRDYVQDFHRNNDAFGLLQYLKLVWQVNTTPEEHNDPNLTSRNIYSVDDKTLPTQKDESVDGVSVSNTARNVIHTGAWDPLVLWVCPSLQLIQEISNLIREHNCSGLTSIGCGTGLLEWLIQAITGVSVEGVEVNRSWWSSKYAPPVFLSHKYADEEKVFVTASNEATSFQNNALMFCYFNDSLVFREYLDQYLGQLVLIIGSTAGDTVTQPGPLDLAGTGREVGGMTRRAAGQWELIKVVPVVARDDDDEGNSVRSGDLLGAYRRRS